MKVLSPRPVIVDDGRNAGPPRLMHRNQTVINLERQVGVLWKRGFAPGAIALTLKMPVAVINEIIAHNAPAVKAKP